MLEVKGGAGYFSNYSITYNLDVTNYGGGRVEGYGSGSGQGRGEGTFYTNVEHTPAGASPAIAALALTR